MPELRKTEGGVLSALRRKYDTMLATARESRSPYFYENILPNLLSYLPTSKDINWLSSMTGHQGPQALLQAAAEPVQSALSMAGAGAEAVGRLPLTRGLPPHLALTTAPETQEAVASLLQSAPDALATYANENPVDVASMLSGLGVAKGVPDRAAYLIKNERYNLPALTRRDSPLKDMVASAMDLGVRGAALAGPVVSPVIPEAVKRQLPPHVRGFLHYFSGMGKPLNMSYIRNNPKIAAVLDRLQRAAASEATKADVIHPRDRLLVRALLSADEAGPRKVNVIDYGHYPTFGSEAFRLSMQGDPSGTVARLLGRAYGDSRTNEIVDYYELIGPKTKKIYRAEDSEDFVPATAYSKQVLDEYIEQRDLSTLLSNNNFLELLSHYTGRPYPLYIGPTPDAPMPKFRLESIRKKRK